MDTSSEANTESSSRQKKFVRSFLFSMRVDSPIAKLHFWTKIALLFGGSFMLLKLYDQANPDPVGCIIFVLIGFLLLFLSGSLKFIIKTYLFVILLGMISILINWLIFNPASGKYIIWTTQFYSGYITIGLSLSTVLGVACFILFYRFSKGIFLSLIVGLMPIVALYFAHWNPRFTIAHLRFLHPLSILVSEITLLVGMTKIVGFMAMMLISLLFVMTTRDSELVGAIRQLRVPYKVSFFMSLVFRHLSTAVDDYLTIRQAQTARGLNIPKKSALGKLKDLAYIAVPLTIISISRSREVATALEARSFSSMVKQPIEFHEVKVFTWMDVLVLLLLVAIGYIIFVTNINFTNLVGLDKLWS